jgi:hypothetical protein
LNKRQRKIGKVMGEFKDGTLKSGGSGKKVTNPKQAIAIALSEAEGMNQGGMMYNQIMQRPMFQTPQQRQGMGIMAGVAPVRGYAEGDLVSDDFFSFEKTEAGSGLNLRDLTDFFIVDPEDPEDRAIAAATIPLMIFPPAAIVARLANAGYKASKAIKAAKKAAELQERMPGFFGKGTSRGKTYGQVQGVRTLEDVREAVADTFMGQESDEDSTPIGNMSSLREEFPAARLQPLAAETSSAGIEDIINVPSVYDMTQGYSSGGIAALPSAIANAVSNFVGKTKIGKAIEALDKGIDAGRVTLDDIFDAIRRGDINPKDADALIVKAQQVKPKVDDVYPGDIPLPPPTGKYVPGEPVMRAEDLAPTPPKPPAKVADDAAGATKKADKKADKKANKKADKKADKEKPSLKRRIATGTAKTAGIGAGLGIASDIGLGTDVIPAGLEKIGDAYGAVRDDIAATLEMPEVAALTGMLSPDTSDDTESTEEEKVDEAVAAQQKPDTGTGTGTPKPEATGIMKFLFGKDGIGGEPGALGRLGDKLTDPRTQYALARASQPTEGFVPRNFYSDFVLGQAEYDQLQGKDETALMQNYEFLKQAGKSDDEIFDLLLSKDTSSDLMNKYRDTVLSLFNESRDLSENVGANQADLLKQAQATAAQIIFGTQASEPQDSDVVETVDI